jgi:hypothetical protein
MGYTTEFRGEFAINKPLSTLHKKYLEAFSDTRRMARNEQITSKRSDPIREAVGLPVGVEGGYFVSEEGYAGQGVDGFGERPSGVTNYNCAPKGQPGLWCQWVPNEDGTAIVWNGGEKFYYYVEWLKYIIEHFLAPWGYVLNGEIEWEGEDRSDVGTIISENNVVRTTS